MSFEFWFEFASTYSYLTALRIEQAAAERGVEVRYRPFLLGPLFKKQQGLADSPFNAVPVKGAYMWRDVERCAADLGAPFRRPRIFPANGLLAARTALVLSDELGPVAAFVREVYRANFERDQDIAEPATLRDILTDLGLAPERTLERAASEPIKHALRDQTARAEALGIFGAPSFISRGELFWGNDRLEQALAWHARGEHAVPPALGSPATSE